MKTRALAAAIAANQKLPMTTRTIRIKSGLVYGSEMERPEKTSFYDFEKDDGDFQDAEDRYNDALTRYEDSFLLFEDRERVEKLLPRSAFEFVPTNSNPFGGGYKLKDGDYSLSLEAEVINQPLFVSSMFHVFLLSRFPDDGFKTEAEVLTLAKGVEDQEEIKRRILEHESNYPLRPQKLRPQTLYSLPEFRVLRLVDKKQ